MGFFKLEEALKSHGFIQAEATEAPSFQAFPITAFIDMFVCYGPGTLAISFDKPLPETIPEISDHIMILEPGEGFGDKYPRACNTIYYKCITPGQTAKFKGWGV